MTNIVILKKDGTLLEKKIVINNKNINSILEKQVSNNGDGNITELGKWNKDNYNIIIFGWENGIEENKHELPPPLEDSIFYGDICCCKFEKNGKIGNFLIIDYENFYNEKYGCFDTSDEYSEISNNYNSDNSIYDELVKEPYTDSDSDNDNDKILYN